MVVKVKAKKNATKARQKVKAPAQRKGRTSTSRLSSKNQLTVPVDILRRVGLEAGDEVEFAVNDAGLIEFKRYDRMRELEEIIAKFGDTYINFDLAKERKNAWRE